MKYLERTRVVIGKAEQDIRALIVEAAESGDYSATAILTDVATELRRIVAKAEALLDPIHPSMEPGQANQPTERRRPGAEGTYPRYERENGTLVKVGWMKKSRKEYIHRVSKDVFDVVVRAISELAHRNGRILDAEQIARFAEELRGEAVPMYQIYVGIAFLKAEKLVRRIGREGYYPVRAATLVADAERAWSNLGS